MEPHFVHRKTRLTSIQLHPKMELHGKRFHCNGVRLSLARKPLASKIITAFMRDTRRAMTREALVQMITPPSHKNSSTSDRCIRSREQCLNRLLSRLRIEFRQKFQGVVPEGTYWFHYTPHKSSWLLYKLPGEGADGQFY